MSQQKRTKRRTPRWERSMLTALTYPGNIFLGSLAVLVLSLGIITVLPAAISLARAFARWIVDNDDKVFTNTFREFRDTWRRTLGLGIIATVVLAIMVGDGVFLAYQLAQGGGSIALMLSAAVIPVAAGVCVLFVSTTAAATLSPDADARTWVREGFLLMLQHPRRALFVSFTVAVTLVVSILLPTIAPFAAIALPVYVGVRAWGPKPPVNDEQV
ncbi:YesL family protein [Salinibacterium sp. NG22]|uniref:DUF624 domain-containing protein n=1 Tax=Salinibacterium sp. NG22 TaxID=2792040 RepID=UPI0018CE2126|nr:DUF624 domain-containing protein [Salinibacterium sp. NG22]MBH0110247.1 YesL family protein [Salinibacterium sp. NG22]